MQQRRSKTIGLFISVPLLASCSDKNVDFSGKNQRPKLSTQGQATLDPNANQDLESLNTIMVPRPVIAGQTSEPTKDSSLPLEPKIVSSKGIAEEENQQENADLKLTSDITVSILEPQQQFTNLAEPYLKFVAPRAVQQYVTNESGCSSGGTWEEFSAVKAAWPIATEQLNNSATVYVKFFFADGSESDCISDSIVHDNIAPAASRLFTGPSYASSGSASGWSWSEVNDSSEVELSYEVGISTSADGSTGDDVYAFTATKETSLASIQGLNLTPGQTYYGLLRVKDAAGNVSPTKISAGFKTLSKVTLADLSSDHLCVLLQTGAVKCWGNNDQNQLHLPAALHLYVGGQSGDMGEHLKAVPLENAVPVIQLAAGMGQSCALLTNGNMNCWGDYGSLVKKSQFSFISIGYNNICGVNATGVLSCAWDPWSSFSPVATDGLSVVQLSSASDGYSGCHILSSGSLQCWGWNSSGQLGLGHTRDVGGPASAVTVDLGSQKVRQVAVGGGHNCAVLADASIKCWGDNAFGQLGLGDSLNRGDNLNSGVSEMGEQLPTVKLGEEALQVAVGWNHSCALLKGGTIKCWGRSNAGQLGLGKPESIGSQAGQMEALQRVSLGTGQTATAIFAAGNNSCALLDDGAFKCWGANGHGQLGQGDKLNRGNATSDMGDNLPPIELY